MTEGPRPSELNSPIRSQPLVFRGEFEAFEAAFAAVVFVVLLGLAVLCFGGFA